MHGRLQYLASVLQPSGELTVAATGCRTGSYTVRKQKRSTTCPPAWTEQLLPSGAGCARQQDRCPGLFGSVLTPGRRLPAGMSCWTDTISTPSTAHRSAACLPRRHCRTACHLYMNCHPDSPQRWHLSDLMSYLLKMQLSRNRSLAVCCYALLVS